MAFSRVLSVANAIRYIENCIAVPNYGRSAPFEPDLVVVVVIRVNSSCLELEVCQRLPWAKRNAIPITHIIALQQYRVILPGHTAPHAGRALV